MSQSHIKKLKKSHIKTKPTTTIAVNVFDPRDRIGSNLMSSKRQRVGVKAVDIAAAAEEAARQADEDEALANPLMRGHSTQKSRKKPTVESNENTGNTRPSPTANAASCWMSRKLRVRIVDENGKFKKWHTRKGVIKQVDAANCKADIEIEGDPVERVSKVAQDLLETVVTKTCKNVEIIRGEHQGMLAEFVSKNPRENVAVVRLGRAYDNAVVEMCLDDVCEFV